MNGHRAQHGFTLIELLVAILVFSIMSVMAYSGLQAVLDARTGTEQHVERLVKLQTAFTFIGRDVEQAISRGVRDSFGDATPAMTGGGFGSTLVEMTRAGVSNPGGFARSSLQRVAYSLKEKELARWTWPVLDQGEVMEPLVRPLIKGISEIRVRFLDNTLEWHDSWPVDRDPAARDNMPRAVEVVLDVDGLGEIRRLFRVAPGSEVLRAPAATPTPSGGGFSGFGGGG